MPANRPEISCTHARKTINARAMLQSRVISKITPMIRGATAASKYPTDCDIIERYFVPSALELLVTHKRREIGKLMKSPIFPSMSQMITRGPESRATAANDPIFSSDIAANSGRASARILAKCGTKMPTIEPIKVATARATPA